MAISMTHENKQIVWDFWQQFFREKTDRRETIIRSHLHADIAWNGPHPINRLQGIDALITGFWQPLLRSFPDIKRRSDILMGGRFGGQSWVCATGYFTGTFTQDWLQIPATNSKVYIRFGEFCRVNRGKIDEIYILLDILDVIRQAGIHLLPPSRGTEGLVPGPATEDGVLLMDQDELESQKSLALVEAMIAGLLSYDQIDLRSMDMAQYWDPQMHWYGPCGIGTSKDMRSYERNHAGPFLHAFPDRRAKNHKARLGEGYYIASTGWPSVTATHRGEYLGCPATGRSVGMRVMDWWRREDDYLMENWVLIDLIDLFLQFGLDLMALLHEKSRHRS